MKDDALPYGVDTLVLRVEWPAPARRGYAGRMWRMRPLGWIRGAGAGAGAASSGAESTGGGQVTETWDSARPEAEPHLREPTEEDTGLAETSEIAPAFQLVQAPFFLFARPPFTTPRLNWLRPHPDAEGPHTTFKRDPSTGRITGYEDFRPQTNLRDPKPWESVRRYDDKGDPHHNKATGEKVETPHVHDPATSGELRPALPNEIPGG